MRRDRRLSEATLRVLQSLAADPSEWRHGYDLCKQTGLKAGSMYPILIRLAERGWLETSWETGLLAGRPPRHRYRLTPTGLELVKDLAAAGSQAARTKHARLRPQMEGSS
jgi:DNA-binding PadR family transcriptional regulator